MNRLMTAALACVTLTFKMIELLGGNSFLLYFTAKQRLTGERSFEMELPVWMRCLLNAGW